jgi:hypothetical protein
MGRVAQELCFLTHARGQDQGSGGTVVRMAIRQEGKKQVGGLKGRKVRAQGFQERLRVDEG